MKRYVLFMTAAAALGSLSVRAQDDGSSDVKQKAPKEIIIKKLKPDEKGKTVIVIEGDKVTINGKPANEWGKGKVIILPDDGEALTLERPPFPPEAFAKMQKDIRLKILDARDAMGENSRVRLGVYTKENEKGAEITRVMDSSAAFKAGLKDGDIIVKVNDSPISDPEALAKVIREHQPNEEVTVKYIRDSREETAKVTLEKPKVNRFENLTFGPGQWNIDGFKEFGDGFQGFMRRPRLGAHIQDMDDGSGVKVLQVDPESPAAKAGLQKDDVITAIAGQKVAGTDQALDALRDSGDKHEYTVTVNRGGASVTLEVKIPHELKSATL
jgi:serine protease Do